MVTDENSIDFLGLETARVLSTPHLIGYMEMVARNLLKSHLGPDEDSVGPLVHVRHLSATPRGMWLRFRAEVISVDGQRVTCRVEAYDEKEKAGEGTHERFVVDVARFAARVQAKAASK